MKLGVLYLGKSGWIFVRGIRKHEPTLLLWHFLAYQAAPTLFATMLWLAVHLVPRPFHRNTASLNLIAIERALD